jgi:dGTP triphosphohydrolase
MTTISELDTIIQRSASRADATLGIPGNDVATPNEVALRIKGPALLAKNADEQHWPGGRTHFQIDRDQILFNPHFVRLARKTQVFIGQRDALYKNRLMHTLEVVQFSLSVARAAAKPHAALNESLVEAIAYGHDIGHTPFGHAGEEALNSCLYEYYIRDVLKTLLKHSRSFDRSPTSPSNAADPEDDRVRRRDQSIWQLVQSMIARYPGTHISGAHPLETQEAAGAIGDSLLEDLIALNVVCADGGICYFAPPLQWKWPEGMLDVIRREFWMDDAARGFFAHNVHALRVLLADKKREKCDVTFQTAWGILTHTPRAYESFTCFLPGSSVTLTTDHETPEAYLVRQADDICFANSDLEDAKNSTLLEWKNLTLAEKEAIWGLAVDYTYDGGKIPENSQRLQFCENGFSFSRTDGCQYEKESAVRAAREVIRTRLYPALAARQQAAKNIIRDLFWFYAHPPDAESRRGIELLALAEKEAFENEHEAWDATSPSRVSVDFIAHMTDDEAMDTHRALFAPEHARWARHFMKDVADG